MCVWVCGVSIKGLINRLLLWGTKPGLLLQGIVGLDQPGSDKLYTSLVHPSIKTDRMERRDAERHTHAPSPHSLNTHSHTHTHSLSPYGETGHSCMINTVPHSAEAHIYAAIIHSAQYHFPAAVSSELFSGSQTDALHW